MYGRESGSCGQYGDRHDFGEPTEHEERGVLVVTHGRRAGRIYTVERSWTERTCGKCKYVERSEVGQRGSEWPSL